MSQIVVELTPDEQKLLRAFQKAVEGEKKVADGAKKMTAESRKAKREMEQYGKQLKAAHQSPFDRHASEMKKLQAALKGGHIDQKTFTAEQARLNANLRGGGQAASAMKASVVGMIGGLAGGAALIRGIGAALQFSRGETDKAVASFNKLSDSRRSLAQIAISAEDLQQMNRGADTKAAKFGVDRDVVRQVMFSGRSEGFEGSIDDILAAERVIDPLAAAGVAGQVPGLFKDSGLKPMEAISATLVAAGESRLNFEQIASGLPKLAEGGAMTGADPSETMGVMSVMASRFASGDTAAMRLKAFATKLGLSEQFGGKGIIGGFEAVQGADEETRKKFLGDSQEVNAAYKLLSEELPVVKQRVQQVDAEIKRMRDGGESTLQKKTGFVFADERERAMLRKRQAGIAREVANEEEGTTFGAGRDAEADRRIANMKRRGVSGISQYGAQTAGELAKGLGAGETITGGAVTGGGALTRILTDNPMVAAYKYFTGGGGESQKDNTKPIVDAINNQTDRLERANRQTSGRGIASTRRGGQLADLVTKE